MTIVNHEVALHRALDRRIFHLVHSLLSRTSAAHLRSVLESTYVAAAATQVSRLTFDETFAAFMPLAPLADAGAHRLRVVRAAEEAYLDALEELWEARRLC